MLSGITEICNLELKERDSVEIPRNNFLSYYTVQSFKGLERNIIFYIDVDGFNSVLDRRLNYIAMSRARLHLYMFYKKSIEQEYLDATDKGSKNLLDF